MTDERMALLELVEKSADADLVREMLAFAARELTQAIGADLDVQAPSPEEPGTRVRVSVGAPAR